MNYKDVTEVATNSYFKTDTESRSLCLDCLIVSDKLTTKPCF